MAEPHKVPKYQLQFMAQEAENNAHSVVYLQWKPFTVAIIGTTIEREMYVGWGATRCYWKDRFDPNHGRQRALGRACQDVALRALGARARDSIVCEKGIGTILSIDEAVIAGQIPLVAGEAHSGMEDELNPLLVGA